MSFGAPPAGPPQQAEPPSRSPSSPTATHAFPDLHSLAADVQSDLGALATGLAHAGASASVVQKISAMAGTVSEVTHILSSAPPIPNPAHAQAQAAQQHAQPQAPQPNQPQAGGAPNPHKALASAVSALAQHAAASAQQPGQ